MNIMPNVARLMGVKIGQVFQDQTGDYDYRLTKNGLQMKYPDTFDWVDRSAKLNRFLTGELEVVKI